MNIKPSKLILPTIVIGALLMTFFHSVAMASPYGHDEQKQMAPEKMHEHMKARLDKLAERLEIKASQQTVWEEFAKSVEPLAERSVKKPDEQADAAAIARYRADRATEFAKKLTVIAEATAKLQAVLTENQRKTLNLASRHFLHNGHGRGLDHDQGHEWNRRGSSGNEDPPENTHNKGSW